MNQGQIPLGEAVDEQLESMGIQPADLDYVLLTHLDCDHANGLRAVKITREDGTLRAAVLGWRLCHEVVEGDDYQRCVARQGDAAQVAPVDSRTVNGC